MRDWRRDHCEYASRASKLLPSYYQLVIHYSSVIARVMRKIYYADARPLATIVHVRLPRSCICACTKLLRMRDRAGPSAHKQELC